MTQTITCLWTEEDGYWVTACKKEFTINEGTPIDNGMYYCCFCGKIIEEQYDKKTKSN